MGLVEFQGVYENQNHKQIWALNLTLFQDVVEKLSVSLHWWQWSEGHPCLKSWMLCFGHKRICTMLTNCKEGVRCNSMYLSVSVIYFLPALSHICKYNSWFEWIENRTNKLVIQSYCLGIYFNTYATYIWVISPF